MITIAPDAHCDEAVGLARNMGSRRLEAIALFILAEAALHTRRYGDLREIGSRSLELSRAIDDQEGMALALSRLGMGAAQETRLEEAWSQLGEALEYANSLWVPGIAANCCYGLAVVAARWNDPVRGARLVWERRTSCDEPAAACCCLPRPTPATTH